MEPINYQMNVLNPLQMALQGYQAAQQGRAGELGMRQTQQNMELAANQDARAEQELAMRQQAAAEQSAAMEEARAGQQAMVALYSNPNPTPDDFRAAMAANPTHASEIRTWWDGMDTKQRENNLGFGMQLAYALGNGHTDVARSMLQTRIEAAENAGDKQTADTMKSQLQLLESGEDGARALQLSSMGALSIAMDAEGFNEFLVKAMPVQEQPEWVAAPPEVLAAHPGAVAGQVNTKTGEFKPDPIPSGRSITVGPNGTTILEGQNVGGQPPAAIDAKAPEFMLATVDSVLNDPALKYATGAMSFLQAVPGTPMKRFGTKVGQLQGQAFLQAFQSLKGAGQITELEGKTATAAIARLDSAQSAADFREALMELRGVLEAARSRLSGSADATLGASSGPQPGDVESFTAKDGTTKSARFRGGDPGDPSNWEVLQ